MHSGRSALFHSQSSAFCRQCCIKTKTTAVSQHYINSRATHTTPEKPPLPCQINWNSTAVVFPPPTRSLFSLPVSIVYQIPRPAECLGNVREHGRNRVANFESVFLLTCPNATLRSQAGLILHRPATTKLIARARQGAESGQDRALLLFSCFAGWPSKEGGHSRLSLWWLFLLFAAMSCIDFNGRSKSGLTSPTERNAAYRQDLG